MSASGPINPVEAAANAIRAGLLIPPGAPDNPIVKLPTPKAPKVDGRTGPRRLRGAFRKRYVILAKDRPDLFP